MDLTYIANEILKKRYLKKNKKGKVIENVQQMLSRVSAVIANVELKYDANCDVKRLKNTFFEMMNKQEFLPNSPTLMNAGNEGQLFACFVLPVGGSKEEVDKTEKDLYSVHMSGGGTGFNFSKISKPKKLQDSQKISEGVVGVMRNYSKVTQMAQSQSGKRCGANMAMLNCNHPEIMEFISCKIKQRELTNFNISVSITDEFMQKLFSDEYIELISPIDCDVKNKIKASEIFNNIIKHAWLNGEPGIVFIDRVNEFDKMVGLERIEATNPCGEQPLRNYESCNLGSINLVKMLSYDTKKGQNYVDFDKFKTTIENAVHFLDNVIDANKYPLEQIEKVSKQTRKIGLGVMGFADMLLELGIKYDSGQAVDMASKIAKFLTDTAREKSRQLAMTKGSFPLVEKSIFAGDKMRNATVTTIAPTGSISLIANCSQGIEPIFSYVVERKILEGKSFLEINAVLSKKLEKYAKPKEQEKILQKIVLDRSVANVECLSPKQKEVFVTAHQIPPDFHIKIQQAFQNNIDNAVSKTINLKSDATEQDVRDIFLKAFKAGLKGVTLYRDLSRDNQVLNFVEFFEGQKIGKNCAKQLKRCPECGEILNQTEGCSSCESCGYSVCEH